MRIEHSIDIAAPVERVWELTMDVESWPNLTPTITLIERLEPGPLTVGAMARIKQPGQRARIWTVTALEPNQRFSWATRVMGMKMTGGHYLAVTTGGTTNTLTLDVEGPLSPVLGRLLRRPFLKSIQAENEGFKRAAERAANPSPAVRVA